MYRLRIASFTHELQNSPQGTKHARKSSARVLHVSLTQTVKSCNRSNDHGTTDGLRKIIL